VQSLDCSLGSLAQEVLRGWNTNSMGLRSGEYCGKWRGTHLYELRAGDVGWSTPYPDVDWSGDFLDARKARLNDILEDIGTKKLIYMTSAMAGSTQSKSNLSPPPRRVPSIRA